jgi:hypothetical protein
MSKVNLQRRLSKWNLKLATQDSNILECSKLWELEETTISKTTTIKVKNSSLLAKSPRMVSYSTMSKIQRD